MIFNIDFAAKNIPIVICTRKPVIRCSFTETSLIFSPGILDCEYVVRLAQCAKDRTGAAHNLYFLID